MRAEARKAPVRFAIAPALSLCILACGRSPLDLPELEPSVPVPGVTDAGDEFPVEPDCSAPLRNCGPVELPPPARYHCALDDPATWGETLVAVIAGTRLYLVQGGGAVLEAHHFSLVEDEEHYVPTATLVARGPRIAAAARLEPRYGGNVVLELVILDRGGQLLFHETHELPTWLDGRSPIHGNEQGLFVFSRFLRDSPFHRIVDPASARTSYEPFGVVVDPTPEGIMLVDDVSEPSTADYAWYDPDGARFISSCYDERPTYWSQWPLSPGLVYAPTDRTELVYERGMDRCRVPLAVTWPAEDPYPTVFAVNRSGWVLTGKSYPELHVVTANVVTGVSRQGHGLQLPEGYGFRSPFPEDVLTDAIIDNDGALTILPEREIDGEPAARIFRTFDGSVWEPLGEERVLAPSSAYARRLDEVGGTYLFSSDRPSESGTGWRPFMQVIRPADGFLRDLPGKIFGYQVSEDGRCIARFDEDDRLELIDLTTGVTHYGPVVAHADAANAAIVFVPMQGGGG